MGGGKGRKAKRLPEAGFVPEGAFLIRGLWNEPCLFARRVTKHGGSELATGMLPEMGGIKGFWTVSLLFSCKRQDKRAFILKSPRYFPGLLSFLEWDIFFILKGLFICFLKDIKPAVKAYGNRVKFYPESLIFLK